MTKTLNKNLMVNLLTLLLIALMSAFSAAAEEPSAEGSAFDRALEHYEAVRLTLNQDESGSIPEHGQKIQAIFEDLSENFSTETAGVAAEHAEGAQALLPDLLKASTALAKAADLEPTREAFYDLSKLLVRYRKLVSGERPAVAYCSMHKKSWLQPSQEEIGNPYAGQSMPKCGEVVSP